jgi:alkylhydroperoxidase family enzyme
MADAQAGHSDDPKTAAALAFALKLVEHRGPMADADIEALRAAGFGDGQIVEIIAHVALNLFTNYVNIARRSGGLPKRKISPRCLERVPIK